MSSMPPPPPGGGAAPPPQGPAFGQPAGSPAPASFWSKLFDFEFREFVTPSVVKVLYIVWIVAASVMAVFWLIAGLAGLSDNSGAIILVLLAPVGWFLSVVYGRVLIEVFIALIRTAENTGALLERDGGGPGGPPTTF